MEFSKYIIVALAHIILLVPIIFYIGLKTLNGIPFTSGESQLILMTALFTALYHSNNIWLLDSKLTIGALVIATGLCWIIWKLLPSPVNDQKLN
jgi:hypothetical protein